MFVSIILEPVRRRREWLAGFLAHRGCTPGRID
jgi:hypothetical protein